MTDKSEAIDLLKKSDFWNLDGSSQELLAKIADKMQRKTPASGEVLHKEGVPQEVVFFVEKGRIKRTRGGVLVDELKHGDVSGLLHVLANRDVCFATLIADEDTVVWTLTAADLEALLALPEHGLAKQLLAALSQQVRKQSKWLRTLQRQSLQDERFAIIVYDSKPYDIQYFKEMNLQLAAKQGKPTEGENKGKIVGDESEEDEKGFFRINFVKFKLDHDTVSAAAGYKVVCVFVNDTVDHMVVNSLSSMGVELIAFRSAGYDNVDLQACRAYGMNVVRVPAYSPHAVAEHAVCLMLTLNRKVHRAYSRVSDMNFLLDGLMGFDMYGKTAGIIGTGKIGVCTVQILLGFGMQVLCYDVFQSDEIKKMAAAGQNVRYVDNVDELLSTSDIISLHVPLLPSTKHMINKSSLAKVKPNVMLINTSRGPLIETDALLEALRERKIGSVGLDVYEGEKEYFFYDRSGEVVQDNRLLLLTSYPNVVLTPHQAFFTTEALTTIAKTTLDNVLLFSQGKKGKQHPNAVLPPEK